ncbi:hypothetical protein BH23CHL7_BH23CHL7_08550 [soil metagenome]
MSSRPRLVTIPSDDAAFAEHANSLLARIPGALSAPGTLDAFAHELRRHHPTAVVRSRDPLADISSGEDDVWYVTKRRFGSRLSASLDIPADRASVFQVYVGRMPEWQVAVRLREIGRQPGSVRVEYAAAYNLLGRTIEGQLRVVDASPPQAVRVEAEGMGVRVWYVTTFQQTANGTRLEVAGDYHLPRRIAPAAVSRLIIERKIAHDVDRAHSQLLNLCVGESQRAATVVLAPPESTSQLL